MALALPDPSTDTLKHSPLSLVVCQVRHEINEAASDPKRGVAIRDSVKDRYGVLEQQTSQDLAIAAGPSGVQALPGTAARGWKIRSEDETWNAVVMPEFFSLETTSYGGWDDFRKRFEVFATAVSSAIDVSLEQRVGLRMIDRITHPDVESPQDWEPWIHASLLGTVVHEQLGPGVATTQQVVQLEAGDGRSVILRHGCFRDQESGGRWTYLLDHDCFVQRGIPFEVARLMEAVDALHILALQVFQAAVTPALYDFLKG